jgi:N-acetylmuramoyl-L-alanine amidase
MRRIVLSSGHGLHVSGAADILDEVTQARRVVRRVAELLDEAGADVTEYHDDLSLTQDENLIRIVNFHNACLRDLDVSVHFNAYESTTQPMGTECLYLTEKVTATDVATAIAEIGGFINRGAKYRDNLFFLNNTDEPAILIEVCFIDSSADVDLYLDNFESICTAIAVALLDEKEEMA